MPTYDTGGGGTVTGTGSTQTIATFSVGANSNRVLMVLLFNTAGAGPSTPSWNGTSMTNLFGGNFALNNGQLFILTAPTTGSHNLTANLANGVTYTYLYYSVYNCSQTQADNTANSGVLSSSPSSLSITPNSDSDMVVFFGMAGSGRAFSSLTGAGANNQQTANGSAGIAGNSGSISPPSSQTGTAAVTGGSPSFQLLAVALKAQIQTATMSDSISNGASRFATNTRAQILTRTASDSVMNAASRFATFTKGISRTMSDSIMNAASRFVTLISVGGIWKTIAAHTSSWATPNKSSTSWSTPNTDASSWTNQNKST